MNTVILATGLAIVVPVALLVAAVLLAPVFKRSGYSKQQIDAATADFHKRRKAGESLAVMTQPEPDEALP